VRGQDQLDAKPAQELRHAPGADSAPREPGDRVADGLGDRRRVLRALAIAQRADAMDLLGEVDQVEVDREGGGGGARGVHRQLGDRQGQAHRRVHLAGPARLGERADVLLGLEERGGLLRAEHLAEGFAQQVDGGREVHSGALRGSRQQAGGVWAPGLGRVKRSAGTSLAPFLRTWRRDRCQPTR